MAHDPVSTRQADLEVLDRLAGLHVVEEAIRTGRLAASPELIRQLERLLAMARRWAEVADDLRSAA